MAKPPDMKILHVWDQAGVACILARHQRRQGHEVDIMKRAGYDPFSIFAFYGEPLMDTDGKSFINSVTKRAREFDVIHVHSLFKIIPDMRKKYKHKTIILHYHGSEARRDVKEDIQLEAEDMADAVLGSTPDLEQYVGKRLKYIPNPVDTDHFKPREFSSLDDEKAFTFRTTGADTDWTVQYLRDSKIEIPIDVIDRQANPVPYSDMPKMLTSYSVYVDLKYIGGRLLLAPSKTALECLGCGLRVLDYKLQYLDTLPDEHRPESVSDHVLEMYRSYCC